MVLIVCVRHLNKQFTGLLFLVLGKPGTPFLFFLVLVPVEGRVIHFREEFNFALLVGERFIGDFSTSLLPSCKLRLQSVDDLSASISIVIDDVWLAFGPLGRLVKSFLLFLVHFLCLVVGPLGSNEI